MSRGQSSQHFLAQPHAEIPRSTFDLSQGHKTSINAGWLVPFYADEVLPGDTFNLKASIFARLATPLRPIMDNIYLDLHFFFCPNRLLWENWQRFCGEQDNPGDSTDFLIPQVTLDMASIPAPPAPASTSGIFYNYLGIPTLNAPTNAVYTFSNMWGRAYNRIWNEFFRDQQLQTRAVQDIGNGPDNPDNYFIRTRGKRHDYFTSCLPAPQKGPGVGIPIAGTVPVTPLPGASPKFRDAPSGGTAEFLRASTPAGSISTVQFNRATGTAGAVLYWDQTPGVLGLEANLANIVGGGTINSLRQAFQIQRYLERDNRGGTRYTEKIRAHFGVTSPDARLQRPEYLGGGSIPVVTHPVPQSSGTPGDISTGYTNTPQGNLAAYGIAAGTRNGFVKSFVEHGVLLGLMSIRADLNYQQGLHKKFSRKTALDFYWPAFSHLGEQAVLNKEIYHQGDAQDTINNAVFGYQERWLEYRMGKNLITGVLQSAYPQSLDIWHLAEDFETLPTLSDAFIQSNPPINRIIAVPSEPHFIVDAYLQIKAARPLPTFSIPGMSDHF